MAMETIKQIDLSHASRFCHDDM